MIDTRSHDRRPLKGGRYAPLFFLFIPFAILQVIFATITAYYEHNSSPLLILINYLAIAMIVVSITVGLRTVNSALGRMFFLSALIFIVLTEAGRLGLLAFSGSGFTSEVFYHFEPTSIVVGWSEYKLLIVMGLFISVPVLVFFSRKLRALDSQSGHLPLFSTLLGIGVLGFVGTVQKSPVMEAVSAWISYQAYSLETSSPDLGDFKPFIDLNIVNSTNVLEKSQLEISVPNSPKNLILIYLESFNYGLSDHPDYPQLTPYINELQKRFPSTSRHYTSAFVTIEGLISSQCGTLLPMFRNNDSFMESNKMMPAMACLSDILNEAGYTQHYYGGTKEEFAGTDRFLIAHGYDEVRGWDYWKTRGREPEFESWGLGDSDLFDEVHKTVKEFTNSDTPFHISVATMGTHVPGFQYKNCSPYLKDADPFLNAVHCTDQLLKQFISNLEKGGLLENTLVFIMGDHGVFSNMHMRNLFGDMVDDRRILTIAFPAPELENDWITGGYDVAPTLLDLLGIEHNQNFLYGRSAVGRDRGEPQYVTRNGDWISGTHTGNPQGGCAEPLKVGDQPINHCHKTRLLHLTQRMLNTFGQRPSDHLSCIYFDLVRVNQEEQSEEYTVTVSGKHAYRTFTYQGVFLRDTMAGFYLVEMNQENDILGKSYFPLDEKGQLFLSAQMRYWGDEDQLILIYLPESNTMIDPTLTSASENLGISLDNPAVFVYQPQLKDKKLREFPIDSLPFSLDRKICNELFH